MKFSDLSAPAFPAISTTKGVTKSAQEYETSPPHEKNLNKKASPHRRRGPLRGQE